PGGPRASATAAASPSASPSPSEETTEQQTTRLTSAFQAMLRKYVPGASWSADTSDSYPSRDGVFVFATAQAGLRTDGDTHDNAGTGNVWVDVEQLGGEMGAGTCAQPSTSRFSGGHATCEQRTVGGATVIVQVDTAPNGSFTNQVTVSR